MRNNQAKPGIDWYEIEIRVKGGESLLSISKDYDISREAIRKRSLKEGWLETNKNIRLARQVVAVATKEKVAVTKKEKLQPVIKHKQMFKKDTPEIRDAILVLLSDGNPRKIAAEANGVSQMSFNRWMEADVAFADNVRKAESTAIVSRLQNIAKAGKRGDWKADSWYLERTQREIFGNNDSKNSNLAVQINIHRDQAAESIDISTTGAKPVTLDD